MQNTYIYGLRDPRDWRIRYIGRTSKSFSTRLLQHKYVRSPRHYTRRENWIQALAKNGLQPTMEFLEVVPGNGFEEERKWIAKFREMGHELVNGNDGGGGVVIGQRHAKKHKPFPEELRKRFSEMYKGKPVHPNFAASWAARRGKPAPRELVEKRAAAIRSNGKRMPDIPCRMCKKEFRPRKWDSQYCSKTCADKGNGLWGHHPRGEANLNTTLSADKVLRIRRMYARGYLQREIAEKFGVSNGCIYHVLKGNSWSWLK